MSGTFVPEVMPFVFDPEQKCRAERRFQAAVAAMQVIMTARAAGLIMPEWDPEADAADAVRHADALLAALKEKRDE